MGMTLTCDECGRDLTAAQGDRWHWVGEEQRICLCSCCDPKGQAASEAHLAKMEPIHRRMIQLGRERMQELGEWPDA